VAERPFLSRHEHFPVVGSTNDVVRAWLANGTPEVCLAAADEQLAGRGRHGRSWSAPPGAGLLLSLGFRPSWLPPERAWQLAASVSLAMAEAAEAVAVLAPGSIRLKWPNDLVVESSGARPVGASPSRILKLCGVLGETDGLAGDDPRVVVGIGINVDWAAADFPPELAGTMTSLRAVAGDQAVDRSRVLRQFIQRLEARLQALQGGSFEGWAARQATTGRTVTLETVGGEPEVATAVGADEATGALLIGAADGSRRSVLSAEVVHVRLAAPSQVAAPAEAGV
jgi:BirA family transcriptional regulator, biotin operon repressor / biotin---[acetyl-CoA-carboxylase] ligase